MKKLEMWIDFTHTRIRTKIGDGLIDGIVKMNMYEDEAAKELDQFIQK